MSKSGTPETNSGLDAEVAQEPKAAPASPPQNQLSRRVAARIEALVAILERIGDDPTKYKQMRAIQMALKGAHDSMNHSGEKMGRMEAAQMTRWLESTNHFVSTSS